jgi:transposase
MTLEDRIAQLETENAALREQVRVLLTRVRDLEARLAKDSHNSSKPPSSDGLARKTHSLRRRSGQKPGGQIGHPGETLPLAATPDAVVEHRPAVCSVCQTALDGEPAMVRERRPVWDLPALRLPCQ